MILTRFKDFPALLTVMAGFCPDSGASLWLLGGGTGIWAAGGATCGSGVGFIFSVEQAVSAINAVIVKKFRLAFIAYLESR
jgi:hypothetical protein